MSGNPVAIVTGGKRGIGKAIVGHLARLGYDIIVNHVSPLDEAGADELKKELEVNGARCEFVQADVGEKEGRERLVSETKRIFGQCQLLVNNAGIAPPTRVDILEASEDVFERVLKVNLQGPYFLTQAVANWMIEQKQDECNADIAYRIINVTSISSYASTPARGEYCVSKAGMSMATSLYANRLADYGIGVFEIRPGVTKTDMTEVVTEKYNKMIADGLMPIKRWGVPDDVALAVDAIVTGKLDFSTGQILNVDGGYHLRRL